MSSVRRTHAVWSQTPVEAERSLFRLDEAPPELRDNPIVRFMAEMDPETEKLSSAADRCELAAIAASSQVTRPPSGA